MNIKEEAKNSEGWTLEDERIIKKFKFDTFVAGIEFVNKLAEYAEEVQHHPGIRINYSTITVIWTTFSTHELKEKDIEGAKATDKLYG